MTIRVLSVGLLAGLIAGLLVSAIQQFTTTPLILEAEKFETASAHPTAFRDRDDAESGVARLILVHADHAAEGGQEAWRPNDGLERTLYTSIATVATAIGFALLLLGGLLFSDGNIDTSRIEICPDFKLLSLSGLTLS